MKIKKLEEIQNADIQELEGYFEKVVVIPTETVYGLAARIDNEEALRNIFKVKGRPSDNPLIVHVSSVDMLKSIISDEEILPDYLKLMEAFWPGPLSLLFKSKESISKTVRGNSMDTIVVRMPKNAILRGMIDKIGVPLAAPSANKSGRPSPTTLDHVIDDLGPEVEVYIDGGECESGLESTIFGISDCKPVIFRPGNVTKEQIEGVLGYKVDVRSNNDSNNEFVCPGQKYKHYSPVHPVYLFLRNNLHENMQKIRNQNPSAKIGILQHGAIDYKISCEYSYDLGNSKSECARNIFAGLRFLDKRSDIIFVVGFEIQEEGLAIMDRLSKAASFIL